MKSRKHKHKWNYEAYTCQNLIMKLFNYFDLDMTMICKKCGEIRSYHYFAKSRIEINELILKHSME